MEHFYHQINGYMNKQNIKALRSAIKNVPANGVWVELGSWTGKSAAYCVVELINRDKLGKFYCVDTWAGAAEHQDHELIQNNLLFETFKKNIELVADSITPLKMISWEAATLFDDNTVDFCYVDAAHDYESVTKDLQSWWPKIKEELWIGGDDYTEEWPGVVQAVNDFFSSKNITVECIGRCWMVQKS
jgi:hypothetical protein